MTAAGQPVLRPAIANRLWAHYFGRGLVEPIDDLRATNPATNEPLLAALAKHLRDAKYDLKAFTRTLLNSRALPARRRDRPSERRRRAELLARRGQGAAGRGAARRDLPGDRRAGEVQRLAGGLPGDPGLGQPHAVVLLPHLRPAGAGQRLRVRAQQRAEHRPGPAPDELAGDHGQDPRHARARPARWPTRTRRPTAIIDELYLAALSRYPDRRGAGPACWRPSPRRRDRRAAVEDVLWALLNSQGIRVQSLISRSGVSTPKVKLPCGSHFGHQPACFLRSASPAARRLRIGASGLIGGLTLPRLLRVAGDGGRRTGRRQGQGVHLPLPGRRPQHHRHVGPEARRPGRDPRAVQADRAPPCPARSSASTAALRQDRRQVHDPPQPQPQRQRPHHRLPLRDDRLPGRLRRRHQQPHAEQRPVSRRSARSCRASWAARHAAAVHQHAAPDGRRRAGLLRRRARPVRHRGRPGAARLRGPGPAAASRASTTGAAGPPQRLLAGLETVERDAPAGPAGTMSTYYEKAHDLITSPAARKAFDITLRAGRRCARRYGYTTLGQCALLARRLVEAGCRFVGIDHGGWDTHFTLLPEPGEGPDPARRPGLQRPGHRPGPARPARQHAGRDDGRDGPHAADQRPGRPRPLVDGPERAVRRRRHQAGPGHRRHRQARRLPRRPTRSASRTSCCTHLPPDGHRHRRRPTTRRWAGRCRSSTAGGSSRTGGIDGRRSSVSGRHASAHLSDAGIPGVADVHPLSGRGHGSEARRAP